jgi:hypothetical protein
MEQVRLGELYPLVRPATAVERRINDRLRLRDSVHDTSFTRSTQSARPSNLSAMRSAAVPRFRGKAHTPRMPLRSLEGQLRGGGLSPPGRAMIWTCARRRGPVYRAGGDRRLQPIVPTERLDLRDGFGCAARSGRQRFARLVPRWTRILVVDSGAPFIGGSVLI